MRLYDIDRRNKQLHSFTSFTSEQKSIQYIDIIKEQHCGMLSDAGTPGLSDPGKALVKFCREYQLPFEVLPGATALIPAVVAGGFDTSSFVYLWFLPTKKGRQTKLKEIIQSVYPVFVYESVHRILKTLTEIHTLWFSGKVLVARELSKMHEQLVCADIVQVIDLVASQKIPLKGEFVVGFGK